MESAVARYLSDMGIPRLAPGQGYPVLELDAVTKLQFEESPEQLLVIWSYELAAEQVKPVMEKILMMAHRKFRHEFQVQPGMVGTRLATLTIQMPLTQADSPTIREAVELLCDMSQQIA